MTGQIPTALEPYPVFDVHAHLAAPTAAPALIEAMDRVGVSASTAMVDHDYEWPNGVADTRRVNDLLAAARASHPRRLPVALGTVEPFHGSEACLAEIDRLTSELHLDGMVWDHHAQGTGIDDQRMVAFAKVLAERGLPAFVHVNALDLREGPSRVESLARRVPEATIVALGALGTLQREWELSRIASACPNLLFDTTVSVPMGPIEAYVDTLGASRILFGTDLGTQPARAPMLEEIVESGRLSDADKGLILWGNAARLFPRLNELR
ncbi:MAG TPA: amidohydrolase family protein [Chloroflexota bacterium]|jgi:hypothetical protein